MLKSVVKSFANSSGLSCKAEYDRICTIVYDEYDGICTIVYNEYDGTCTIVYDEYDGICTIVASALTSKSQFPRYV